MQHADVEFCLVACLGFTVTSSRTSRVRVLANTLEIMPRPYGGYSLGCET